MDEHGYFAFGGSTILLLFQKNKITFDPDLVENSSKCLETIVKVGNSLGTVPLLGSFEDEVGDQLL
jgi:phosphatidylserine decarboxylase